jgi:GTP-binding protein YchF
MRAAVVGLPASGKTTLFNLLTGSIWDDANGNGRSLPGNATEMELRMAKVPDVRISYLSDFYKPKKTTYAQIEVSDVPGISPSGNGAGTEMTRFLSYLRTVDAFVYLVRTFQTAQGALPVDYKINPIDEVETLNLSLVLADMQVMENRLERLKNSRKLSDSEHEELKLLEGAYPHLADGMRLDLLGLTPEQVESLKGYAFLTLKPVVLVGNLSEDQFLAHDYPGRKEFCDYSKVCNLPVLELSAKIEWEILGLPSEDRSVFLEEYGIEEPAIAQLSRMLYRALGLISFFTVGEDEVKAWSIPQGTSAKHAAGAIHSDIQKGFIRAEAISFEDFKESGSVSAARSKGLYRLEGKDYIVKDGDIITFRFAS